MGKQKHEEHENHERWIIPYADMVTLLFAFFVVMYSMSQQDLARLKNVSESLQEAFVGHRKGGARTQKIDIMKQQQEPEASPKFLVRRSATNQEIVDELRKKLMQEGFDFIFQNNVSPIQVTIDSRGVIISISGGFLFEKGATEVSPQVYPVLELIADMIKSTDRQILVEGHTDDQPIVGNIFYSNWELSALRATSTVRLFIERYGIAPGRLTASGYAQYRPIADNSTPAGRDQNRRVEIIMLNASLPEDRLEDPSVPR